MTWNKLGSCHRRLFWGGGRKMHFWNLVTCNEAILARGGGKGGLDAEVTDIISATVPRGTQWSVHNVFKGGCLYLCIFVKKPPLLSALWADTCMIFSPARIPFFGAVFVHTSPNLFFLLCYPNPSKNGAKMCPLINEKMMPTALQKNIPQLLIIVLFPCFVCKGWC